MNPFNLAGSRARSERGQSIIELALIIPILFVFFFGLLEFTVMFVQSQRVTTLSREVANAAFRDCSSRTGAELNSCLQGIVDQINVGANINNILPSFTAKGRVVASVYDWDLDSNAPRLLSRRGAGSSSQSSKYDENSVDKTVVQNQGVIAIGEIYYNYTAITPITSLLDLVDFPTEFYGVTIY